MFNLLNLTYLNVILASSLSHVSSSTPSSTPTDSESHHSGQILHPAVISESSTQQSLQITDNSVNEEASSDDNAPPPPPISSRPERTKSIVSFLPTTTNSMQINKFINIVLISSFFAYSTQDRLMRQIWRRAPSIINIKLNRCRTTWWMHRLP